VTLTDLQGGDTTYAGTFINGTVASTKTFSLLKAGGGSLTLTNTGSTYTGLTEIDNGILNVASLGTTEGSAGGVASSIGASGNAAANLVFGGAINGTAILQYTGTTGAISTDRLLTIGDLNGTSATLDSSSATAADTMSFTNTGSIAIASTGGTNAADTHNLTLTGSNPGTVTSMNVFAPSLIDGNKPTNLVKSGAGTWVLTNVNPYSGGTTVSGGKLYANGGVAGTSSGLGTGAVTVSAGAAVGGSGVYRPTTAGAGITLQGSASSLISGGIQTSTTAGAGLTLDNRVAGGTILNASTGTANLTFSLGAGNPTGTTAYNFANPNTASTFMTVYGSTSGELSFAAGDTITLTDLTSNLAGGFGAGSTTLQLVLKEPYLLIQAESTAGQHLLTDNNLYSGLMTSGGVVGGVLQNGYVTTPLTIGGTVPAGENALVGFNADRLYLYNGQLEVVPEPGTWALMLGGLTLLVFVQRRRKNDREV
jgi:fibronectin-binding autotransporter adhesin